MIELKTWVKKIDGFFELPAGKQIKYFVFYLCIEGGSSSVTPKEVNACFTDLHINGYSNVSAYLKKHSSKGDSQEFINKKDGYVLLASLRHKIEHELDIIVELPISNSLYPLDIFEKAPGYLQEFASEATKCYDVALYNSCLFMLRKICEILLIELFESRGFEEKIKTSTGDYFQLSQLIKSTVTENSWKLSRIVKDGLPKIKQLADSSVHSKRFKAKKPDIDHMKTDVRILFEEIIMLIDYPIRRT